MPANQDLFDAQVRHAMAVNRFGASESKDILDLLLRSEADLEDQLRRRLRQGADLTSERMKSLMRDAVELRRATMREAHGRSRQGLYELAKASQEFEVAALEEALPVRLDYATMPAEQLRALVSNTPFGGSAPRTLSQWYNTLAAADQMRIVEAVQLGVLQGETVEQMVRRVRAGTELTRAQASTVVRTGVNHVVNSTRAEFFARNSDIAKAKRWTAVLDGRTTLICSGRDGHFAPVEGKSTKGVPRPWLRPLTATLPAHPNERSIWTTILNDEGVADMMGERPFVRDTRTRKYREMDFRRWARDKAGPRWKKMTGKQRTASVRRLRRKWTKEAVGQVPSKTSFDEWLRRQPRDFQNEYLGLAKAKMFREGMRLDQFVDRFGATLTIRELVEKFPSYAKAVQ